MPDIQQEPLPETPKPSGRKWSLFRFLRRLIVRGALAFFAFLFLVYFLLLIPPVQQFAVEKISTTLASELQTEVSLGRLQFQLFDKFVLSDLEIKDRQGATLIQSGRTEINFQALLLNLLRKRLVIQDLTLQHTRFNVVYPQGATEPNIQFLVDYLSKDKPVPDSLRKPLDLRVKTFFLEDVQVALLDSVKGSNLTVFIREGDGLLNSVDLPGKKIDAKHLFVDGLKMKIEVLPFDSAAILKLYPDFFTRLPDPLAEFPALCVDILHLRDADFQLFNYRMEPVRLLSEELLDFNYLDVFDINMVIRSLSYDERQFDGSIDLISFRERSGFELEKLTAGHASVSNKSLELFDMKLTTPKSSLGDTLIFTYKTFADFITFPDDVKMDIRLRNSEIWMEDIMAFAPELEKNLFFIKNRDEVLSVDGNFLGKINSLRGKDLRIRLGTGMLIEGDFSSYFLAVPGLASLNARLERLDTQMKTLRDLIPGYNLPANFDRLGRLNFSGSFDGFFSDFVAYGDLRTELGRATMDMKLSSGGKEPLYSGKLSLLDFDLKEFTGDPDFGSITFTSQVLDGKGLTGATANARLEAQIDSFTYKNYMYKNLAMQGQLNKNLFDGKFGIQDQNIDFDFVGAIDFTGEVPFFNFNADVRRVDLLRLNLSKEDFIFSGKLDMEVRDIDLNKIQGEIALRNFLVLKDREKSYVLDSLTFTAQGTGDRKSLSLRSELLNGDMNGRFNLSEIPAVLFQFLDRNYQAFSDRMGIPKPKTTPDTSHFQFELDIANTGDWLELLIPTLGPLAHGRVEGYFNNINDSLLLELDLPSILLGDMVFEDVYLNADALRDTCVMDFGIFRTILGDSKRELAPFSLLGLVNRDTLNFSITAVDYDKLLNKLEMDGVFYLDGQNFLIRFAESKLVILNDEWNIQKNNFLRFGKDFVQTRDFVLSSGNRRIILQSLDRRGLQLFLRDFDLAELNGLLDYEPMQFAGGIDMEASIDDLFALSGLHLIAQSDSLIINKIDYGALRVDVEAENLKSAFQADATITRGNQKIVASGFYNPPNYQQDKTKKGHPATQNYLDAKAELYNFPLAFLEIWIGDGVSDTEGLVTGSASFTGDPAKPELKGKATVRNGATTIDFLNTRYFIDKQTFDLTSTMIDGTGAILTDQLGNKATLFGGITHDHLKDMGLNAQIRTDNFMMLNSKKGQNDVFYGTAIASGNMVFSGPMEKADIYVNATSKSGTHIVLPISSSRNASEVRFIHFTQRYRKPESEALVPTAKEAIGVSVVLDLQITDDAIIEMVFDEQAGDILRGRGNGTIQMVVPRTGDFLMYGEYVVSSGDYLFTLMNLVNKPFEVRRGGSIRWSGDPFKAEINIGAEYKDLKAPLTNFIAEYLATEPDQDVKTAAALPTEVDLVMNLSGELLSPKVAFDIQFPRVPNELKNYTDSKLRILQQDQNEMNRQVFGLIVIGQFLPSQFALQGQELAIGINTLTEMLSQQLSLYVTGLVSEWLSEDGLISGIDFDIAYNYIQGTNISDPDQLYRSNELQVRLKNYLFDDRLALNVGGNFDLTAGDNIAGPLPSSGVYFAGDLAIEYFLTQDQTLKVRFYQSTEPEIGGGRRNKTGLGLSYRKEFDTFDEFIKGLKGATKRMKDK